MSMQPSNSVTVLLSHKDFNALVADSLDNVVNKPYKSDLVVEGTEIGENEVTIIYHVEDKPDE